MKYPPFVGEDPQSELRVIVTIPSCGEQHILDTLESIYGTVVEESNFEVLVILNHGASASSRIKSINEKSIVEIAKWRNARSIENLHVIKLFDLPDSVAGVGHARKTVMDEAMRRLIRANRSDGIIACTDGDTCVDPDYVHDLIQILNNSEENGFAYSFNFEHPLNDLSSSHKHGIMQYELHLRYFRTAIRWTGHPHAFFTVGSAMACRLSGYIQQGGMNQRKAGEDFYFLQMFAKAYKLKYVPRITVYPSARSSDRVPFGTGRAMLEYQVSGKLKTYSFKSFRLLKNVFSSLEEWYHSREIKFDRLDHRITPFLNATFAKQRIEHFRSQAKDRLQFERLFYTWFDAFKFMKGLHYLRDEHGFEDVSVNQAFNELRSTEGEEPIRDLSLLLWHYRERDRID